MIAYQRARDDLVSGCLCANSFKRFRVMTCIIGGQRYLKCFQTRSRYSNGHASDVRLPSTFKEEAMIQSARIRGVLALEKLEE